MVSRVPTTTLRCDQAIFTSIRTPTGEGYRIIAASRGLRPGERQTITRFSPSHDALCSGAANGMWSAREVRGVSFYALPSGRLCAAYSCDAGDEHTGRGGKRIYTHNLIFEAQDLERCAYNSFAVLRAALQIQDTSPQLNPPPILPDLELAITESALEVKSFDLGQVLGRGWRRHVLQAVLDGRSVIVNIPRDWFAAAEALVLAIPGPMRAEVSFGAGLKFSLGRCHRLSLLRDDRGVTRTRVAGQPVEYLNPAEAGEPSSTSQAGDNGAGSAWLSFVERHLSRGDAPGLAQRTSRPFDDFGNAGRERIGRLYNQIDALGRMTPAELLRTAVEHLNGQAGGAEAEIVVELLGGSQCSLLRKLRTAPWAEVREIWPAVCTVWWQSEKGWTFAGPMVEQAVRTAGKEHPIAAAEAALQLANACPGSQEVDATGPSPAAERDCASLLGAALERLAHWAERASDGEIRQVATRLDALACRWQARRPRCPILERIHLRCKAITADVV